MRSNILYTETVQNIPLAPMDHILGIFGMRLLVVYSTPVNHNFTFPPHNTTQLQQQKTAVQSRYNQAIHNRNLKNIYTAICSTYNPNLHCHKKDPFHKTRKVKSNTTTLIVNSNNKGRTKKPTTEYRVRIQNHKKHSNKISNYHSLIIYF
jgi:hypothetical protein